MKIRKVLTAAGSDPGGGAGIQADLKTFASLGVYGSSVITALTAQNTLGVSVAEGVSARLVEQQLAAVLGDIGADAAKTGMLHNQEVVETISAAFEYYKVPRLVVDPVMVSSSGQQLLDEDGIEALRERLMPQASFVTPNLKEAEVLCGFSIAGKRDLRRAARELHLLGSDFVVVTGIRSEGEMMDVCYDGSEFRDFRGPYIPTPHTHGTGCTYSAALAVYLARGASPWTAVGLARQYVSSALRYGYPVGQGQGPLNHLAAFFPGQLADPGLAMTRSTAFQSWDSPPRLTPLPLLNVIIGGPLCAGKDYTQLTRWAVANGAGLIQLREKEGDTRQLVETASRMCRVCHEEGALFVVNDRVDIAAACGADGVHIGQEDLDPAVARAMLGPERILGISAGSLEEAQAAWAAGADYLGVGPVYPTSSKDCRHQAGGSMLLAEISARVPLPLIAIGGVTPQNTEALLEAGASGVAVISAVLGADDPVQAVHDFMRVLQPAATGRLESVNHRTIQTEDGID